MYENTCLLCVIIEPYKDYEAYKKKTFYAFYIFYGSNFFHCTALFILKQRFE